MLLRRVPHHTLGMTGGRQSNKVVAVPTDPPNFHIHHIDMEEVSIFLELPSLPSQCWSDHRTLSKEHPQTCGPDHLWGSDTVVVPTYRLAASPDLRLCSDVLFTEAQISFGNLPHECPFLLVELPCEEQEVEGGTDLDRQTEQADGTAPRREHASTPQAPRHTALSGILNSHVGTIYCAALESASGQVAVWYMCDDGQEGWIHPPRPFAPGGMMCTLPHPPCPRRWCPPCCARS